MDTGLFIVDEKFLLAVMRLKDDNNADFRIVMDHIKYVSNILTDQGLHIFPDFKMNYAERLNFTRGFAASLDVLKNIFEDPEHLVDEFREQEEFTKAQRIQQVEEGGEE